MNKIVIGIPVNEWFTKENNMPLTKKGKKVKKEFEKEYGKKKGEQVFYATENKRKMKGLVKKGKKK